jgi:predicted transcriptional regulator
MYFGLIAFYRAFMRQESIWIGGLDMKVGILGPKDIVEHTHNVLESKNEEKVVFVDLIYDNYKDTLSILEVYQAKLDVILFTGKVPYVYSKANTKQVIPWAYCPREVSSLMGTMLEVSLINRKNIERLSIDTYQHEVVEEALVFVGLEDHRHEIQVADQRLLDEEYEKHIVNFHTQNYYLKHSTFCITCLSNVYKRLKDKRIPCIRSKLTNRVILTAFSHLKLIYLIKENQNSQIVAISIAVDNLSLYSVVEQDEYQYMLNKMKIAELIYKFAAKIEAAVTETSNKEFLLFTTRKMLEIETDNFNKFELIQNVEDHTFYTISVGIGYGATANKAKFNAVQGMNASIKSGGNFACVAFSENHIQKIIRKPLSTQGSEKIDKILDEISSKTGVSSKILYKIHSESKKNGMDTFTVTELAKSCDINYRTLSRIIQKLEKHGYCNIVGERIVNDKGRPSRILKLNYFIK